MEEFPFQFCIDLHAKYPKDAFPIRETSTISDCNNRRARQTLLRQIRAPFIRGLATLWPTSLAIRSISKITANCIKVHQGLDSRNKRFPMQFIGLSSSPSREMPDVRGKVGKKKKLSTCTKRIWGKVLRSHHPRSKLDSFRPYKGRKAPPAPSQEPETSQELPGARLSPDPPARIPGPPTHPRGCPAPTPG